MERFIVAISGASGFILGLKTVNALASLGYKVDLIITDAARITACEELGGKEWNDERIVAYFSQKVRTCISCYTVHNIGAPCASGSYPSKGMIIIPCSMSTLAAVALGLADNLLRRAADVTIKERRKLVIVPRELPLSPIHLEHMCTLARLNVVLLPPQPAWYLRPKTMEEMENFFVARAVEQLGVQIEYPRWKPEV
jgi:flavin prenyltransferase